MEMKKTQMRTLTVERTKAVNDLKLIITKKIFSTKSNARVRPNGNLFSATKSQGLDCSAAGYKDWKGLFKAVRNILRHGLGLHLFIAVKVQFLYFNSFSAALTKFSLWRGDWALRYHSMEFRHFPGIS